jgi:hypothetical protein
MIRKFKFNDAIEKKGIDNARIHYGVGAQSIINKMKEFGLDPMAYGFVCYDRWDAVEEQRAEDGTILVEAKEAGDRYGIRYEELLCFIIAGL